MMKVNTEYKGLVRGYVIYATDRAGCVGLEEALDENNLNVGVAYTFWYRCDEDAEVVEREREKLNKVYSSFNRWGGSLSGFEYRPFTH